MKIACVVIAYYPEVPELIKNICSYIEEVDQLALYFNSPCPDDVDLISFFQKFPKISIIQNPENYGIARTLNLASLMLFKQGFEWLLMMDQDSRFLNDDFFKVFQSSDKSNIAIFSPWQSREFSKEDKLPVKEVDLVMTSGSLLNLNVWKSVGGFEEKLFIDEVDHEFCLRARRNHYKILVFPNIVLYHELGSILKDYKNRSVIQHTPLRIYYIFRNTLYVINKYKFIFPRIAISRLRYLWNQLKDIILFFPNRKQYINAVYQGIKDFIIGKYNK